MIINIILFLSLTIIIYSMTSKVYKQWPLPALTPVFTSTLLLIGFFTIGNIEFQTYEPTVDAVTFLLGPATVALAVPVYKNRRIIIKHIKLFVFTLGIGSLVTISFTLLLSQLLLVSDQFTAALTVKTATVPIALELAALQNGDPTMTAALVMLTGLVGAIAGPRLLTWANVHNPVARGIAVGTIAHGIGTAHMINEGELQGASAAAAMAVTGIFLSIFFSAV
ncbi:LrgB family protein [Alkalicoccus halolimnae]|uniref:LrgB family protein n=1 Tax=Alkalicoccus halolimnae TaxID=1667239 RepID=A0A5C7FDD4_9BACI|nr:LrgB family protein [Alkalicoccus halolimnae]TXF87490.1 LrgB family protein [Alkalicoccus halolimnae]